MATIAVAGRKGGIGKTTIAGNLAVELTEMGWRVLAIDADPQRNPLPQTAEPPSLGESNHHPGARLRWHFGRRRAARVPGRDAHSYYRRAAA
jgi:hypothetical protein